MSLKLFVRILFTFFLLSFTGSEVRSAASSYRSSLKIPRTNQNYANPSFVDSPNLLQLRVLPGMIYFRPATRAEEAKTKALLTLEQAQIEAVASLSPLVEDFRISLSRVAASTDANRDGSASEEISFKDYLHRDLKSPFPNDRWFSLKIIISDFISRFYTEESSLISDDDAKILLAIELPQMISFLELVKTCEHSESFTAAFQSFVWLTYRIVETKISHHLPDIASMLADLKPFIQRIIADNPNLQSLETLAQRLYHGQHFHMECAYIAMWDFYLNCVETHLAHKIGDSSSVTREYIDIESSLNDLAAALKGPTLDLSQSFFSIVDRLYSMDATQLSAEGMNLHSHLLCLQSFWVTNPVKLRDIKRNQLKLILLQRSLERKLEFAKNAAINSELPIIYNLSEEQKQIVVAKIDALEGGLATLPLSDVSTTLQKEISNLVEMIISSARSKGFHIVHQWPVLLNYYFMASMQHFVSREAVTHRDYQAEMEKYFTMASGHPAMEFGKYLQKSLLPNSINRGFHHLRTESKRVIKHFLAGTNDSQHLEFDVDKHTRILNEISERFYDICEFIPRLDERSDRTASFAFIDRHFDEILTLFAPTERAYYQESLGTLVEIFSLLKLSAEHFLSPSSTDESLREIAFDMMRDVINDSNEAATKAQHKAQRRSTAKGGQRIKLLRGALRNLERFSEEILGGKKIAIKDFENAIKILAKFFDADQFDAKDRFLQAMVINYYYALLSLVNTHGNWELYSKILSGAPILANLKASQIEKPILKFNSGTYRTRKDQTKRNALSSSRKLFHDAIIDQINFIESSSKKIPSSLEALYTLIEQLESHLSLNLNHGVRATPAWQDEMATITVAMKEWFTPSTRQAYPLLALHIWEILAWENYVVSDLRPASDGDGATPSSSVDVSSLAFHDFLKELDVEQKKKNQRRITQKKAADKKQQEAKQQQERRLLQQMAEKSARDEQARLVRIEAKETIELPKVAITVVAKQKQPTKKGGGRKKKNKPKKPAVGQTFEVLEPSFLIKAEESEEEAITPLNVGIFDEADLVEFANFVEDDEREEYYLLLEFFAQIPEQTNITRQLITDCILHQENPTGCLCGGPPWIEDAAQELQAQLQAQFEKFWRKLVLFSASNHRTESYLSPLMESVSQVTTALKQQSTSLCQHNVWNSETAFHLDRAIQIARKRLDTIETAIAKSAEFVLSKLRNKLLRLAQDYSFIGDDKDKAMIIYRRYQELESCIADLVLTRHFELFSSDAKSAIHRLHAVIKRMRAKALTAMAG